MPEHRKGQHEFANGVREIHMSLFQRLFCRLSGKQIDTDGWGEKIQLEAHHVEMYKDTHSQRPEEGLLIGHPCHEKLHTGDGRLTPLGKQLRECFLQDSGRACYDLGIKCRCENGKSKK